MRRVPKLTMKRLCEVLSYDPATGVFTWKISRARAVAGARAGKLRESGRNIGIDDEDHQAARLAWFWVHGEWPSRLLRFKDGNRDNVAISNLTHGANDFTTQKGKNAYAKKWRASNPRSQRHLILRRSYGMELGEYQAMFAAQGGVCAICKNPEMDSSGKAAWLSVDHDHADDSIRGLLCSRCNHMLGHGKDNPSTLRAAASYLDAHATKPKTNVVPLIGRRIANSRGENE